MGLTKFFASALLCATLLSCTAQPTQEPKSIDKPQSADKPVGQIRLYSCQPTPSWENRHLVSTTALVTTACADYKFEVAFPGNWSTTTHFYPITEKPWPQRHEVFVMINQGPDNLSGLGHVDFEVIATPKYKPGANKNCYLTFDEFVKDRCDNHQMKAPPKIYVLGGKYTNYCFLWRKPTNGRCTEHVNQYTQVVFFEGSDFFYEVQMSTEDSDREKFESLYIQVLESFKCQ